MKHGKRIHTSNARVVFVGKQRIRYFAVAAELSGQRGATAARRHKFACKKVRLNGEITKSDKK
jgi:hypothetical protein